MKYRKADDFLVALRYQLKQQSTISGISLDRLGRRVLVERVLARIVTAEPNIWVLKGGMALEVRLGDRARLTRDVDLGLRERAVEVTSLHERLADAMAIEPDGDYFKMTAERPAELRADGAGDTTWRLTVDARLGGKPFGRLKLDVSPRPHELETTELITLPGTLTFADVPAPTVEIIDANRHAAEKFHAMLRIISGGRENTRVRDLVDLVTLREHGLIDPAQVAVAIRKVWNERDAAAPPARFPPLPLTWADRYPQIVADHPLSAATFPEASALAAGLWQQMFPSQET